MQDKIERRLTEKFPPAGQNEDIYSAAVITDRLGRILFWYLPGIVGPTRKVIEIMIGCEITD